MSFGFFDERFYILLVIDTKRGYAVSNFSISLDVIIFI